jgi:hypothetical protein
MEISDHEIRDILGEVISISEQFDNKLDLIKVSKKYDKVSYCILLSIRDTTDPLIVYKQGNDDERIDYDISDWLQNCNISEKK